VDIVILGNWSTLPLRTLAKALEEADIPSDMKVIDKARVPIIKFRDKVGC
jgi:DNA polymerase sigma